MKKKLFYLLSFTWGFPMTLVGALTGIILIIAGKKPKKYGACWHFTIGKNWGGVDLGLVFLTNENSSEYVKNHEHGHAIQNCCFGFLMPFIVCIPSVVRYWYRRFREYIGKSCVTGYYDIWFEKQASEMGNLFVNKLKGGINENH